jgi:hypothetical protein
MIYDLGKSSARPLRLFLLQTSTSNTTPTNIPRVLPYAQHDPDHPSAAIYHYNNPALPTILAVEPTHHQQPQCLPDPSTLPARVLLPIGHCQPFPRDEHESQVIAGLRTVCAYLTIISIGFNWLDPNRRLATTRRYPSSLRDPINISATAQLTTCHSTDNVVQNDELATRIVHA